MPVFEMFLKDMNHLGLRIKNKLKRGSASKTLLVYPHYPSRSSTIYKVGKALNYEVTNNPKSNFDLAIYWEYLTYREEYHWLEKVAKEKRVVNLHSRDLSKVFTEKVTAEVFGYSTFVDPFTYEGKMVQKSNVNATHDGKVVEGPLKETEEGAIYQLLIDNSVENELVMDIRVLYVNGVLDFVYLKYRNNWRRFKTTIKAEVKPTNEVFSAEEIRLMNELCEKVNLEYGELDVLRDKKSGRIYVIDISNTAQGPPNNISKEDFDFAVNTIARRFEDEFVLKNSK